MAGLAPDLPKVEQHIVDMTNQARRERNLSALKVNAMLRAAARTYAQHLANTGQFSHTADGRDAGQRAENAGYKACSIAENLAMDRSAKGFDSGQLAMQAVAGWMNSPSHRANILMVSATEIGVGVARSADPVPKYISVELFARPESEGLRFEVVNASGTNVTYRFGGKTHDLKPQTVVTQRSCGGGQITFSKSGGFFSSESEIQRINAENDKRYTLKNSESGGAISVEINQRGHVR